MKDKYYVAILIISCVVMLLIGSYAFFVYDKVGLNETQIIAGSIYLESNDSGNIELSDMYPMSDEDGIENGVKYQLNIRGHNESEKDLYYGVYINQGAEIEGKNRFKDDEIKIYLTKTINSETKVVYGPGVLKDFNNKLIHADIINAETIKENEVEVDYELTMWIDEKVLISDSIKEVEGRRIYTSEQFKNSYATVIPTVIGDLKEKNTDLGVSVKATLMVSGNEYDVSKDYLSTLFTEEDVKVQLTSEKEVIKFVITNTMTNEIVEEIPEIKDGKSIIEIEYNASGSYTYYGVYEDGTTSTVDTYNIKIDKEIPTFIMQNGGVYNVENSEAFYKIENKITGIVEKSGYSLMYALVEKDESVKEYNKIDLSEENTIVVNVKSGIYDLYVKMIDEDGKEKINKTTYTISYNAEIVNNNGEATLPKTTQKLVRGQTYEYIENLPSIEHESFLGYAIDTKGINMIEEETIVNPDIQKIYVIYSMDGLLIKPSRYNCKEVEYTGESQVLTKEEKEEYTYIGNVGIEAGNYTVLARLNEGYIWSSGTNEDIEITCKIAKRKITYKADDASKVYDGEALIKNTATLKEGSLIDGHTATFTIEGSITNVGATINTLNSVLIKDANGKDVTENYEITKENGTLTVTINEPTISLVSKNAEYNGSAIKANEGKTNSNGRITYTYYNGDSCDGEPLSAAPIKVGIYSVKAKVAATSNYTTATSECVTHTINKKIITATAIAHNKTYDGNRATSCTISLNGIVTGDTVAAAAELGEFIDENAGDNKKVICSNIILSGVDKNNYSLSTTSVETTANITPRSLDIASFTYSPLTKVYDKTTDAPSGFSITANLNSRMRSDNTITIGYTEAVYNDANVSDASSITVSGMSLSGTDALNYILSNTTYTKTGATITKAAGTINLSSKNEIYTGNSIVANTATTNSSGTITYTYYSGDNCSGTALNGAPINVGTYSVKATVAATGNYTSATSNCTSHVIEYNEFTITLNSVNATTSKNNTLYGRENVGIYLNNDFTNKMTDSVNSITIPIKQGYIFGGYYTSENGQGTKLISESGYITNNFTNNLLNNDTTLYAKWTPKSLKIYFNVNSGNITEETNGIYSKDADGFVKKNSAYHVQTVTGNSSTGEDGIWNPDNTTAMHITMTGHSAKSGLEWNTKPDGSGTSYSDTSVYTYETLITNAVEEATTYRLNLYVNWGVDNYTVTYNGNKFISLPSQMLNGVTITYDPNTSYLTLDGTPTTSLSLAYLPEEIISGTMYKTTLTYVSGSFVKEGSTTFTTEVNDSDKKTLTERNYVNATWPTSTDTSYSSTLTVSDYAETVGEYVRVFMWFEDPSTVTFTNYKIKVNLTKVDTKTVTYNSTYGTLGDTPTRPGYTFDGWYTTETGGTQVTSSTKVTLVSDHTLYARWNPSTYTVTYDGNRFTTTTSQTLNGVTISYDPESSYLTLNGTPTASLSFAYLPEEIISGEQFKTTIKYVSGSFVKEGSTTFTTEVADADKALLTTRNYVSATWPTSTNPSYYSVLTIDDFSASVGKYLRVYMWFETPSAITFTNYKIKVNLTKIDTKTVTFNSAYGTLGLDPVRPTFTFDGWYTAESDGTKILSTTQVTTPSNHSVYGRWKDETKPTCTFSGPSATSVKVNATSTYTLTCTDNSLFNDSTLASSDFTLSTSGIVSIGTPTKATAAGGYKYTIVVTGKKAGSTTLTLNSGALSDSSGNTNDTVTSASITIQALVCSWKSTSSTTVYNGCSGTSKPSNPTAGSTYSACSNTKYRYSMGSGTCANGKTYSSATSGYTYTSSSAASSGCTSKRASSCAGSYSQSGGSCSTGSSSTKTTYKYTCS